MASTVPDVPLSSLKAALAVAVTAVSSLSVLLLWVSACAFWFQFYICIIGTSRHIVVSFHDNLLIRFTRYADSARISVISSFAVSDFSDVKLICDICRILAKRLLAN